MLRHAARGHLMVSASPHGMGGRQGPQLYPRGQRGQGRHGQVLASRAMPPQGALTQALCIGST